MATEQQIILKVGTDEAVKSVADLKSNISALKKSLETLEIGSEEYAETLNALKLNQNALRDAMFATSATMEEVAESAAGMSESYNSLVHRMAALKEEWRSTNDEARRNELGAQINEINNRLKEMDASTGNFSRNVGDYKNQMAEAFSSTAGAAGAVINPLKNMNAGLTAISTTPVIAILGLLANIIMKVIENLNSSEASMNRVKLAMAPLSAATTGLTKIFQWLGDKVADAVEWLGKVAEKLGMINEQALEHRKIVQDEIDLQQRIREVNKENADARLEISQLQAKAAEKDKYTAAERLKFIEEVARKEREVADRNIEIARIEYDVLKRKAELAENSAEENDELSEAYVRLQQAETDYFAKTKELNSQRVEAINTINAETKALEELRKKSIESKYGIEEETDATIAKAEAEEAAMMLEIQKYAEYENEKYIQAREAEKKEREARIIAAQKMAEDHAKQLEEEEKREKESAERKKQQRISGLMDIASATTDILGTIADSMEINNEKEFKRQQGLQIAQTTINTLTGAVGAFMQAMASYPAPAGAIIGAAQAAAATAAGVAQIAKIKQQKYTTSAGSSGSVSSGSVSAPNVQTQIATSRTLTSATEEDRLNRMAAPVRAYIVDSDLQVKEAEREQVETETSF